MDKEYLLKQVSRSFYLTLRILPRSIRAQISLAYLLARASDTIADTEIVGVQKRQESLTQFLEAIRQASEDLSFSIPDFGELAQAQNKIAGQGTPAERSLLENFGELLNALKEFTLEDRRLIRHLLENILRGQEMDLDMHGAASANRIAALKTEAELDAYTYSVAGCVGEFWTKMCRIHVFPRARMNWEELLVKGIKFGKGLQLVNILRDMPKDLRQGRCYIPKDQLAHFSLQPEDLLDPAAIGRFRTLYNNYARLAEDYLSAGWLYTTMLPFGQMRIRLACAWPILFGIQTLADLKRGNALDDRHRIKLSRLDLYRLMLQSIIFYPCPPVWNRLFKKSRT
jgi:farnesyl-diphosphate farnesyltransferase